jgi:hypothetical protein
VRQDNSALGHHLDQISRAQFETQVPPYTKQDDFLIEMSSFEKLQWRGCGHSAIIAPRNLFYCLHQNPVDKVGLGRQAERGNCRSMQAFHSFLPKP